MVLLVSGAADFEPGIAVTEDTGIHEFIYTNCAPYQPKNTKFIVAQSGLC